jgi:hypothetical protein
MALDRLDWIISEVWFRHGGEEVWLIRDYLALRTTS